MDPELKLEDHLAELIDGIRQGAPGIDLWPDLNLSMALNQAMNDPTNPVAQFRARLLEDPDFTALCNGWIEGQGTGFAIQDHMLPIVLIRAVLKEGNPARVIDEHRTFATRLRSPLRNYYVISGCNIDQATQITPYLRLLAWSDVPESSIKRKFSHQSTGQIMLTTDVIVPMRAKAGCAIEIDPQEDVTLAGPGTERSQAPTAEFSTKYAVREEIARDVVRCIFLLTLGATDIIGSWPEATDAAARRHFGEAFFYGKALFDLSMLWQPETQLEGNSVRERYLELTSVKREVREVLRHAIDRLNWAKRRENLVDRAIDLGIALEMLLLHGKGDKNELSFRLAAHGSMFIGGSPSHKKTNFALLKRVYQLRSQSVHTGQLKTKDIETAPQDINAAIKLAAEVALKVLELGRFPNWENEVLFPDTAELP
jgi:hypothetical protein